MTNAIADKSRPSEKQIEQATWGVFFVWIGLALLASLPWGVWMIGLGVIILGAQVSRRLAALRLEAFWIAVGALFVIGGVSEIARLQLHIAIIPALCIVVGVGLLTSVLRHASSSSAR